MVHGNDKGGDSDGNDNMVYNNDRNGYNDYSGGDDAGACWFVMVITDYSDSDNDVAWWWL